MMITNNKHKIILLALLNLIILILQPVKLLGQGQIFLEKDEINGYNLESQSKIHWYGPDKQLRTADEQKFKILNSKSNQYIYIQYYVFNSVSEAIIETTRLSQRFAVPYIWGSPTGTVIGEDTWTLLNTKLTNSNALFFVRGNVGIQLFIQGTFTDQLVKIITDKILKKINNYLSLDISSDDINL